MLRIIIAIGFVGLIYHTCCGDSITTENWRQQGFYRPRRNYPSRIQNDNSFQSSHSQNTFKTDARSTSGPNFEQNYQSPFDVNKYQDSQKQSSFGFSKPQYSFGGSQTSKAFDSSSDFSQNQRSFGASYQSLQKQEPNSEDSRSRNVFRQNTVGKRVGQNSLGGDLSQNLQTPDNGRTSFRSSFSQSGSQTAFDNYNQTPKQYSYESFSQNSQTSGNFGQKIQQNPFGNFQNADAFSSFSNVGFAKGKNYGAPGYLPPKPFKAPEYLPPDPRSTSTTKRPFYTITTTKRPFFTTSTTTKRPYFTTTTRRPFQTITTTRRPFYTTTRRFYTTTTTKRPFFTTTTTKKPFFTTTTTRRPFYTTSTSRATTSRYPRPLPAMAMPVPLPDDDNDEIFPDTITKKPTGAVAPAMAMVVPPEPDDDGDEIVPEFRTTTKKPVTPVYLPAMAMVVPPEEDDPITTVSTTTSSTTTTTPSTTISTTPSTTTITTPSTTTTTPSTTISTTPSTTTITTPSTTTTTPSTTISTTPATTTITTPSTTTTTPSTTISTTSSTTTITTPSTTTTTPSTTISTTPSTTTSTTPSTTPATTTSTTPTTSILTTPSTLSTSSITTITSTTPDLNRHLTEEESIPTEATSTTVILVTKGSTTTIKPPYIGPAYLPPDTRVIYTTPSTTISTTPSTTTTSTTPTTTTASTTTTTTIKPYIELEYLPPNNGTMNAPPSPARGEPVSPEPECDPLDPSTWPSEIDQRDFGEIPCVPNTSTSSTTTTTTSTTPSTTISTTPSTTMSTTTSTTVSTTPSTTTISTTPSTTTTSTTPTTTTTSTTMTTTVKPYIGPEYLPPNNGTMNVPPSPARAEEVSPEPECDPLDPSTWPSEVDQRDFGEKSCAPNITKPPYVGLSYSPPDDDCIPKTRRRRSSNVTLRLGDVKGTPRPVWYAGIYRKTTDPYFPICGGSIVREDIVISAAHCFWDDVVGLQSAQLFAVAASKIYKPWKDPMDKKAQKSDVLDIKIPARFLGAKTSFQEDIAILKLTTPFKYTRSVKPICVDFDDDFDRQQMRAGHQGTIAGWGLTDSKGTPTQRLLWLELPYIEIEKCIKDSEDGFLKYITCDKVCAGENDTGKALCRGDSGGGLSFWSGPAEHATPYLRGVASTAPSPRNAECNVYAYGSFTHLRAHRTFLRDHVPDIERCRFWE